MAGVQGRWSASSSASCTGGEICCSDMQRAVTAIGRGSVSALMSDNGGQGEEESLPQNFRLLLGALTVTLQLPLPPFTSSLLPCVSKPAVSCVERKCKRFAFPHMQRKWKKKHETRQKKVVERKFCNSFLFSLSLCAVQWGHATATLKKVISIDFKRGIKRHVTTLFWDFFSLSLSPCVHNPERLGSSEAFETKKSFN